MANPFAQRSFLKLLDFSAQEILQLLDIARAFKELKAQGVSHEYCKGKNICLLFQKTSTRTRCAFEVAAADLGMSVTYLDPSGSQMGTKESLEDTAQVLGRFYDGIEFRGFAHTDVECLAEHAHVPVWNGLTTEWHPTQMLADMLTIQENFGKDLLGKKLVFMGDASNNVARSLMVACAKLGMHYVACGPQSQMPDQTLIDQCASLAAQVGGSIRVSEDIQAACMDADVIYTDVWVSMGEPAEVWEERIRLLESYRVTPEVMSYAKPEAIFLHCLPAFHDLETDVGQKIHTQFGLVEMEVSDEVFRSPQSRVFDEAENRMHTIKAVMYTTLMPANFDLIA